MKHKTKFLLVRHGECDYSEFDTKFYKGFGGNLAKMTDLGVSQIEKTAEDPRLQGADIMLSSPYTRALQTAAILNRNLGLKIIIETDLHEWVDEKNFVFQDYESAITAYEEFYKYDGVYPNGEERMWEDAASLRERALGVLRKYQNYDKVIVACHGMLIQATAGVQHPENGEIVEFELPE